MKKNIIISILSTALISITLLIMVGLIANAQDKKVTETVTQTVDNSSRDTFIQACMNGGSGYAYCACGYDYLNRVYGNDVFTKLSKKTDTSDEIIETYNYCKYLIK